jgi:hypothetical protein
MARDKQLIVRVSEQDREAFNQLCHSQGIGASTVLNTAIERVLAGALSLDILLGKPESSPPADAVTRAEMEAAIAGLREEFTRASQGEREGKESKQSKIEAGKLYGENHPKQELTQNFVEPLSSLNPETAATIAVEMGEGLSNGKLAKKLNIGISRQLFENWVKKGITKTPPNYTFQKGDKAGKTVTIPPYEYRGGKWYPIANGDN